MSIARFKFIFMIARFKIAVCNCPLHMGKETEGRKIGKEFICLQNYQSMKAKQYSKKQREKVQVRSLVKNQDKDTTDYLGALDTWFKERRKQLTGKCSLCGGRTEKYNDKTYKASIHHLFEKRKNMFPSVSLDKNNFLEVCHFGNSCHTNIHNGRITWQLLKDSAEWEMIFNKVMKVFPNINPDEHKNIPDFLMNEIQSHLV